MMEDDAKEPEPSDFRFPPKRGKKRRKNCKGNNRGNSWFRRESQRAKDDKLESSVSAARLPMKRRRVQMPSEHLTLMLPPGL